MLFSIAIPAYKSKFLNECIESILKQTFEDFELIIINDCSPEPIDEIVSPYLTDSRVSYSKNEVNIGSEKLVNNWNNILEKAIGKFFIMMGDDGKMKPNYLEEFNNLVNKFPDLDVYHCRSKIIDENSKAFKLTPSWPEFETVYDSIWHRINGYRLQYVSDFVYRTQTLKKRGGFHYMPLAWSSDDITAFIATNTKGVAHTNLTIFNYRETSYTISSYGNSALKMQAIQMEETWLRSFLQHRPEKEDDIIVYENLLKIMNRYFNKKKAFTMKLSLDVKFTKNMVFWLKNKHNYGISNRNIINATLMSIRDKFK